MKASKDLLTDLLKTVQLGQLGIRSLLECTMASSLRLNLLSQLREYGSIESEVYRVAFQRGWELREMDPAVRFLTERMTRLRLLGNRSDSRIAGLRILGSTRDMIRVLGAVHRFAGEDHRAQILCQKLLDCEQSNIRQMQRYL